MAPHLPTLFGLLCTNDAPVLIHCAAGKDRTGFAVAVLLHALGVTYEAIIADYLLSARPECVFNPVRRAMVVDIVTQLAGVADCESMVYAIMDARPIYLQAAFETVAADYGSMDGYIEKIVGLDAKGLRDWRQHWLV